MQRYLLGIDIGTGSTKAVAVDFDGNALDTCQFHYPVNNPQPGYSEQDPELILKAFIDCIAGIIEQMGYPPEAVSLSSAMHSVIPVDATGKALADMMIWADSRSENIAERLWESAEGEYIYHHCGTPIHAMSVLCKLMWIRENQAELFTRTHKFLSIKEYIWYHLFSVFEVDYAIASATGLFDIKALQWNEKACAVAGVFTHQLSVPINTGYQRTGLSAKVAAETGLATDVPFIIGASDGCCANLGSFISEGMASLTIGTSGAVRITSPSPVYNYGAMIFNYLLDGKTFVCGGAVNNGGIVLNWLLKNFMARNAATAADYADLFNQAAAIPAGSDGLVFLPYLYGERAPLWDTKSCGVFFNIKPVHTRAHFLRAGLEGICFTLHDVLQSVESSSAPVSQVNISGGFMSSSLWVQMLADITDKKLAVTQQEDASAIGAVFLAMQTLNLKLPQRPVGSFILPDTQKHQTYAQSLTVFKRLYHDLKATMHWLHDKN